MHRLSFWLWLLCLCLEQAFGLCWHNDRDVYATSLTPKSDKWGLFIGQTSHHARCCLLVCVPCALPWISTFDTANKACGCDGTVSGFSHAGRRENESCGGARRRQHQITAFFSCPSWSFQHPLVESRRWENNYFVIINVSMHDFLLIQFNYIVKQALSETTGAWF